MIAKAHEVTLEDSRQLSTMFVIALDRHTGQVNAF